MTIEEALASIVDDGINLGAGDFVNIEALKVAADVLRKVIEGSLVPQGCDWIPVSERLPDENDVAEYIEKYSYAPEFLVMIKGATEPTVLQYDGELWSCDLGQTYDVTHWMPLPEPPKEDTVKP